MTDDDRACLRRRFGDFAMMILMPIGVFAVILLVCIVLLLQPPLALPHAPPETVPQASATLPAAEPHADLAVAPPADQVSGAFLPSAPGRSATDPPSVMPIVSSPQTDMRFADFASPYAPPSGREPTRPERKPRQPQLQPRHWHWQHYPSTAQADSGAGRLMRVELQQLGINPSVGGNYGAARHRREASAAQDQYRNH
jgi:hypothetical protein